MANKIAIDIGEFDRRLQDWKNSPHFTIPSQWKHEAAHVKAIDLSRKPPNISSADGEWEILTK